MDDLELIPYTGNPDASQAMTLAHELREEQGLGMSDALSQAWDIIRGSPWDDEDYDEDDEELAFDDIMPQSKRKPASRSKSNPGQGLAIGTALLVGSLGYVAWCAYQYHKTNVWSWTPWKPIGRPLARRIRPVQQLRPPVLPRNRYEQETVTLIVP